MRAPSGTSRRGNRHRREARLSFPALAVLVVAGGLAVVGRGIGTDQGTADEATTAGRAGTGGQGAGQAAGKGTTARASAQLVAASGGQSVILGKVANTVWGDVQVKVTVRGKKVVAAEAVKHPDAGAQSRRINARALPVLYRETVTAQSAKVDSVSGATITSGGYRTSLQSAIDLAQLK